MSAHPHHTAEDIEVLREMIRLAERRRDEELQMVEKINQNNLALIAFSGGFLSLLVTADFPRLTVTIAGLFLLISIVLSLVALAPRRLRNAIARIDEDVEALEKGQHLHLQNFLLQAATITEKAGTVINKRGSEKKVVTILSAIFLAFALFSTYILNIYATTR